MPIHVVSYSEYSSKMSNKTDGKIHLFLFFICFCLFFYCSKKICGMSEIHLNIRIEASLISLDSLPLFTLGLISGLSSYASLVKNLTNKLKKVLYKIKNISSLFMPGDEKIQRRLYYLKKIYLIVLL